MKFCTDSYREIKISNSIWMCHKKAYQRSEQNGSFKASRCACADTREKEIFFSPTNTHKSPAAPLKNFIFPSYSVLLNENFSHYSIFRSPERMENGKILIRKLVFALWKLCLKVCWIFFGDSYSRDVKSRGKIELVIKQKFSVVFLGIFSFFEIIKHWLSICGLSGGRIIIRWNSIKRLLGHGNSFHVL